MEDYKCGKCGGYLRVNLTDDDIFCPRCDGEKNHIHKIANRRNFSNDGNFEKPATNFSGSIKSTLKSIERVLKEYK